MHPLDGIRLLTVNMPACIGMPVEMVTCKIREDGDERGMLIYGYKFRPVLQRN